jgi:hypothetical protein
MRDSREVKHLEQTCIQICKSERHSLLCPRGKSRVQRPVTYLPVSLILAFEVTQDPQIRRIGFNLLGRQTIFGAFEEIAFNERGKEKSFSVIRTDNRCLVVASLA